VTQAVISIESLTRRYGKRRGIENVNLSIPAGALYGFLGPNGAGKTTAIRVLLGFLRPTSGHASVMGMDCWSRSAVIKRDVGTIPGDLRLWPWLTGRSALALFGRIRGRDIRRAGEALAEELSLDLAVPVRKMSRGTRQKLGLVLSMAHAPRVLILDEPTTALDPLIQDRLRAILRRLAHSGVTVFFSSHTLSEVEDLCERIAIVREGRIVADSTLDALKRQAHHEVEIRWTPGHAPESAPQFLTLGVQTPERWRGRLAGPVEPLLAFLAQRRVEDVRIARPNLEEIFARYYIETPAQDALPEGAS
jgi:ABC-2 type transport system ATP-binding protein